jgi:hypothetical protein
MSVYDPAKRRLAQRFGRQRGCRVDIPAEELARAGFKPGDPPPYYRTHGHARGPRSGSVIVSLYRAP